MNIKAFVLHNPPIINQYDFQFPDQNVTLPDIAIDFFYGDPFDESINDESSIWFSMVQGFKYQNITEKKISYNVPLVNCSPDWIPEMSLNLICPSIETNMSGQIYQTPIYSYPKITVQICAQNSTQNQDRCIESMKLAQLLAGGRVILYIRNTLPTYNLNNGDTILNTKYNAYQFFLIQGFYQRVVVTFKLVTYDIYPDYLTRFQSKINSYVNIDNIQLYNSNVTIYNVYDSLSIEFEIDNVNYCVDKIIKLGPNQDKLYLQYSFYINIFVGSFLGSIVKQFRLLKFSIFAAYLLNYNSQRFYKNNEKWNKFDSQVEVTQVDLLTLSKSFQIEMKDQKQINKEFDTW